MNARERRRQQRAAEKMAKDVAAAVRPQAPPPAPAPEPESSSRRVVESQSVVVVPPAMRNLPIDLVLAVFKLVKKHGESEILVKHDGDVITIAVGDAAEELRSGRRPLAYRAEPEIPVLPRGGSERPIARQGNASRFVSSSRLPEDYEPAEEDEGASSVVPMAQANGMPRAPRDRTKAQRNALRIPTKEGDTALEVAPESLAGIRGIDSNAVKGS